MSKKDYEIIAAVLNEELRMNNISLNVPYENDAYYARYEAKQDELDNVISALAAKFGEGNPRFDRAIFVKACFEGVR